MEPPPVLRRDRDQERTRQDPRRGPSLPAGQRADAFHVDLGAIFDLGALRPFNEAHLISMPSMNGVNAVQSYNVHTIALQVPVADVTRGGGRPQDPMKPGSVIGVWATASRRKSRMFDQDEGSYRGLGPWQQVSRLGNPLFNEVIVPMAEKDEWNGRPPKGDRRYAKYVNKPELQALQPVLYPGVFPNLAAYTKPRADLNAILLTGIPEGVVDGFQNQRARRGPTCCGSTLRSRPRRTRTTSLWSPATLPDSRTADVPGTTQAS